MSKLDKTDISNESLKLIADCLDEQQALQRKSNKLASKRNRIEKKKHQQSLLDFEQAERQYLIEKSKLQPTFRLTATEILTCEPDFVNDPEQASEAYFLKEQGVGVDQHVLRLRLDAKGSSDYMHPSIVYCGDGDAHSSGLAFAMSQYVYFIHLDEVSNKQKALDQLIVYFVYRDKTTLPVVHKYKLSKEINSALQRWQVFQVNTVYAKTPSTHRRLETAEECENLFLNKG